MTVGDKTSTRVSQLEVGNEDHTRTFRYWYDPLGNISTLHDDYSAWYYSYDKKGQLTAAEYYDNSTNGGTTEYYTYDNAGNILSKELYSIDEEAYSDLLTTDTYTYSDSVWGDLLTAYNGQPITYDANGNPLSYRGMTLTWAKGRRLATLTKNSSTAYYSYDRDGLRVQKTVGGVTHTYTYLGDRLVCEGQTKRRSDVPTGVLLREGGRRASAARSAKKRFGKKLAFLLCF